MIFSSKYSLQLLFIFSLIFYIIFPHLFSQSSTILNNFNYSPKICNPTYYRLSLLKLNNTFLIHGLWIEQCSECISCGYPTSCNNIKFNISELIPIFSNLKKFWYPAINPNLNDLIIHEWEKHGTCTNMSELNYFNTTIYLYKTLLNRKMLSNCDYNDDQCYFILYPNLTFSNSTRIYHNGNFDVCYIHDDY